tara:strand:+ start:183 stop:497 length:315 start_codon:yes stop_codon:yes gene_type:complete
MDYIWCHGPNCHTNKTQDRIRGVKGSKVLRTRKINRNNSNYISMYSYFCSNGCYNDFANKYISQVIAIAPRLEALETPVDVVVETHTDYYGNPYKTKVIKQITS